MSEEKKIYLKYTGNGAAIFGVPARDLTIEEAEKAKAEGHDLLNSGIYELAEPPTDTEYQNIEPDQRPEPIKPDARTRKERGK